ncbi:MAG: hypothetical protein EBU90_11670 [Proteobacteria bacterium]|nr:hypothetical protein [Pseudomonadota bacterium]NBP14784.1 hypothetical protein [bacterium]
MAINSSNSTFVNIKDLPQAQLALNPDLIIIETQNGTEAITFENLNVVKTDIDNNTTLPGELTGSSSTFNDVNTDSLTVGAIYTNGSTGYTQAMSYSNRIQTTNGVVTSADYVYGSPEYITLYNLYKSLSSNSSANYKKVFEASSNTSISLNKNGSLDCIVNNFPSDTNGADIGFNIFNNISQYISFNLLPLNGSTSFPYVSSLPALSAVSYSSGVLTFRIVLPYVNNTYNNPGVLFNWRLLYFYN